MSGYYPPRPTSRDTPTSTRSFQQFDLLEWYPYYQSCQRYFLDYAQHDHNVRIVAAFINIRLPFQWTDNPVINSAGLLPAPTGPSSYNVPWQRHGPATTPHGQPVHPFVSLVPYVQRLIVTSFDQDSILHSFFGDDWRKGVGGFHECERRNYLFTAKSVEWSHVMSKYSISPHETVPYMKPLSNVKTAEIEAAEQYWSRWLAFQDWMVGPRAPEAHNVEDDEDAHP
ncbi:hypothetical protein M011DRAFT_478863 [Sporormia fimetaria CBS 119925]|uniref:Uncharacterized protein n=1 Tax=Sporormia fimetaria CBS 119925 TaxID=1340428 RepID=A0A6A6V761_9PLEO|nr:hypothetical protein M011DRAFT_478863 [Sporormia fimetaria CBS 119925]